MVSPELIASYNGGMAALHWVGLVIGYIFISWCWSKIKSFFN